MGHRIQDNYLIISVLILDPFLISTRYFKKSHMCFLAGLKYGDTSISTYLQTNWLRCVCFSDV